MIDEKRTRVSCTPWWHGRYLCTTLLTVTLLLPSMAQAVPDNWNVAGEHGVLHVTGALSEGACRLDMQSARQEVRLGVTPTSVLQRPGDRGTPVAFQLYLRDCLRSGGRQRDARTGTLTWDSQQPVASVTFMGVADSATPTLLKVKGTSGLGLRLLDEQHRDVRLGNRGVPQFLTLDNAELTYYVVPERTPAPLVPGAYRTTVDFRVSYD